MDRKRFTYITRAVAIVLILTTAAFAGIVGYTLMLPPAPVPHVPYVGLALAYFNNNSYNTGTINYTACTDTIMHYYSQTSSGLFKINAREELFIHPLLLNATTRQYVGGPEDGQYSHLIPTDLHLGQKLIISLNRTFTVLSTNTTIVLDKGVKVQAFTLYYHSESVIGSVSENRTTIRYYDTEYGILLKELDSDMTTNPKGYNTAFNFLVTIEDDQQPPVSGGLSNYEALFVAHTSPLIANSNSDIVRNGLILALLAVASAVAFVMDRYASRKHRSSNPR
jgi:hypothetical protein